MESRKCESPSFSYLVHRLGKREREFIVASVPRMPSKLCTSLLTSATTHIVTAGPVPYLGFRFPADADSQRCLQLLSFSSPASATAMSVMALRSKASEFLVSAPPKFPVGGIIAAIPEVVGNNAPQYIQHQSSTGFLAVVNSLDNARRI